MSAFWSALFHFRKLPAAHRRNQFRPALEPLESRALPQATPAIIDCNTYHPVSIQFSASNQHILRAGQPFTLTLDVHLVSTSELTTPDIFLKDQTAGQLNTFPNNIPVHFDFDPRSVRFVRFGRRRLRPASELFNLNRFQGQVQALPNSPNRPKFKVGVGIIATACDVESTAPIQVTRIP
jgi:hypothetical protein